MSFGVSLLPLLNPVLNTPQNIAHVVFDITVMKSEDVQSQTLQVALTTLVTLEFVPGGLSPSISITNRNLGQWKSTMYL